MSMDLAVWTASSFDLPRQLPRVDAWKKAGAEWAFESGDWQVLVLVASDEPDDDVLERLGEAKQVAYVTLEPIGAASAAYEFLEQVVRALAAAASGVWVGPNGDVFGHDEGEF